MNQEIRNKRKRQPSTFPRFSAGSSAGSMPLEIALVRQLMGFKIEQEPAGPVKIKANKK